jgi:hypothetical protein
MSTTDLLNRLEKMYFLGAAIVAIVLFVGVFAVGGSTSTGLVVVLSATCAFNLSLPGIVLRKIRLKRYDSDHPKEKYLPWRGGLALFLMSGLGMALMVFFLLMVAQEASTLFVVLLGVFGYAWLMTVFVTGIILMATNKPPPGFQYAAP